ncbi:MAG: hypothetical protein PHG06_08620, partial [Parabacteroides sp.]|nr:hypothetical protein [Parabacteroides sp.]
MFYYSSNVTNGKRYLNGKISFSIVLTFFIFLSYNALGENGLEIKLPEKSIELRVIAELDTIKLNAFKQIFGNAVILDQAMVQKVLSDTSGKRHYVDKDGDGKPEEVWFIDNDRRHSKEKLPILVRVIDKNGNLEMGKEPDKCGDLWIADWHADGLVDAVIDYEDLDSDGDVDSMGMFFYDPKNGLRVWWSRDDGDDNLLWYDVDYIYDQSLCQYKTHFGGDESFCSFYYDPGKNRWIPFSENPFLFYDRNKDGITEE